MAVRTARLAVGSTGAAGVTVTIYTCPTGKTAIVKTVHLANTAGSATSTILAAQSGPTGVNIFINSLGAGVGVAQIEPYLVLEPGDELVVNSSVANAVKYWVSGVELDGVAP